jgi:Zn finger protein HypA/HybF involved in hydrogenase expression
LINVDVPRQSRAKLVLPKTEPEKQALETLKEASLSEQKEEPVLTELDNEIECPRCHEFMELQSSFDKLMYTCEYCSFLLKCV